MSYNGNRDAVQWGATIPIVGGQKPVVPLLRATQWQWSEDGGLFVTAHSNSDAGYDWSTFDAIRLPADHPHYKQSQAASIDWTAPIEAVHEDGRVKAVMLIENDGGDELSMKIFPSLPEKIGYAEYFNHDGTREGEWRIRNVAQTTRTTDEQLTHYAERCKALVERMAAKNAIKGWTDYDEARAIVASMVEADPDLIEARAICQGSVDTEGESFIKGARDNGYFVKATLAAIRRGRALERGE